MGYFGRLRGIRIWRLILAVYGYFCHFWDFRVNVVVLKLWRQFWSIKRFQGVFVLYILWFLGYFGSIMVILVISRVFFLIILDVRGIMVIYEVSRIDNSFLPFRGHFGHFWIYRVILVILELLRLFSWMKRFSGGLCFWTFCAFGVFWEI